MKFISMVDHGRSRLYWVCRWSRGFCRTLKPPIHIRAGENVCIQVINPIQFLALLASRKRSLILSAEVSTGLKTTSTGIFSALVSARAISLECSSTFLSAWSPYRCWLPVTNHTPRFFRSIMRCISILYLLFNTQEGVNSRRMREQSFLRLLQALPVVMWTVGQDRTTVHFAQSVNSWF